jgi:poly-gamma-glutamate capsule biosynthesis protein CapA/YwtB (metallophosphatase superfamily)
MATDKSSKNSLQKDRPRQLTVSAVGDLIMGDRFSTYTDSRFVSLAKIIRDSDVRFVHLEGVICDDEGYPAPDARIYVRLKPFVADELAWIGANLVSCAHNHVMDFAAGGLLATIDNLNRAGLTHAGIGRNLAEARAPAYYYAPEGRVALISICSSFSPWCRAGDQNRDCVGRPGLNPLRFETRYVVDARAIKDLTRINTMLGWEKQREHQTKMGWGKSGSRDTMLTFGTGGFGQSAPQKFVLGDKPGIDTVVNESDANANIRSIKDAKKQADWVLVSLHSHESDTEMTTPARFYVSFAKRCIDAGADAVIGHGPHVLRGIEIYKGKPIFYSLGNFVFQNELMERQPADFYEVNRLNPAETTVPEAWDMVNRFADKPYYWDSICASFSFKGDKLKEVKLYPLSLFDEQRSHRGIPLLADKVLGKQIIEKMNALSAPYNTKIDFKDGIGFIRLT